MRPGDLDRQVLIESLTTGQDSVGDVTETWAEVATVWAAKRDVGGREYFDAAQVNAEVTTVFKIYHRDDVTPTCRLTCDGEVYDIVNIKELGRREGLEIMATRQDD